MLEMRISCECCDKTLPPGSTKARICSFERTYCAHCAETDLGGKCPGCGGELMERPRRAAKYLVKFPPSAKRYYKAPSPAGKAAVKKRASR